jgi:hypothetical protein
MAAEQACLVLICLVPAVQNVRIRNKSAVLVYKKTSSSNCRNLELLFIVYITANDWNNSTLGLIYCFDRNVFLSKSWMQRNEENCEKEKIPHGGSRIILQRWVSRRSRSRHHNLNIYKMNSRESEPPIVHSRGAHPQRRPAEFGFGEASNNAHVQDGLAWHGDMLAGRRVPHVWPMHSQAGRPRR